MSTTRLVRDLAPPGAESWRAREQCLFDVIQGLAAGDIPADITGFDAYQRRVLGYLAETAALLLARAHRDRLLALAARCRESVSLDETVALLPGADPRRACFDDIAKAWKVVPALDLSRLRTEMRARRA